jgi:hypothetical protein
MHIFTEFQKEIVSFGLTLLSALIIYLLRARASGDIA